MKKAVALVVVGVVWCGVSFVSAAGRVEQDGTRTVNGETIPLYSVSLGDPGPHERKNADLARNFGPFAVNGTVFVRFPADSTLWYGVEWRTPLDLEEMGRFLEEKREYGGNLKKYSFYRAGTPGPAEEVLPRIYATNATNLNKIFSVVIYQDGSGRVILEGGTTLEEAQEVAESLQLEQADGS